MTNQSKPRTTVLRPWLCGTTLAERPEQFPREIAAKGVHKVVTEKIISQGEFPPVESLWVERRLRMGRSVVRGKSNKTYRGKRLSMR